MSNMQYYVPLECNIRNPGDVGLLLLMRLRGLLIGRDTSLEVRHGGWIDNPDHEATSVFHRIDGISIEGSAVEPFRKVILNMEGTLKGGEKVFALLEYNPKNPESYSRITLSPVPFVQNSRPELPFKGERLKMFLRAVKIALGPDNERFRTVSAFEREIRRVFETKLNNSAAVELHGELIGLELVRRIEGASSYYTYEPLMTLERFEQIFGVKLPEDKKPVKQPDPWRPGKEE